MAGLTNRDPVQDSRAGTPLKKVGGCHFWHFENKQNKTDPRLGFAPPEARWGMVYSQWILEFVITYP